MAEALEEFLNPGMQRMALDPGTDFVPSLRPAGRAFALCLALASAPLLGADPGAPASAPAPAPASGPGQAPAASPAPSESAGPGAASWSWQGPFNPGLDLRINFVGILANAQDVDAFYQDPSSGQATQGFSQYAPQTVLAFGTDLGVDYGWEGGLVAGVDFFYGPNRTNSATNTAADPFGGTDTELDTFSISQLTLMVTPGWRFRVQPSVVLEPRLGLGVAYAGLKRDLSVTPSQAGQSAGMAVQDTDYDAGGVGAVVWPEIRGEYLFGHFGVGLSLGYLYNAPTIMKYTSLPSAASLGPNSTLPALNSRVTYEDASGVTRDWTLSTSGFTGSIYATYHFTPLFAGQP